jgi:alpha-galactosidase
MLAAPLIAGNDVAHMSKETRDILLNKEVIAVDQDTLGIQGFKYSEKDGVEVWFKPLAQDAWAMCVLNRTTNAVPVTFDWKTQIVSDSLSKRDAKLDSKIYRIRDLWKKSDAGDTTKPLSATVPAHDILMLKLQP